MGNVILTPGELPSSYCFQSWQKTYNDFFSLASAQLSGALNTFNYGDSIPAPENRGSPWLRTIAGRPDGWYIYFGGQWVWPNDEKPSTDARGLWVGTLTGLKTHDGGEDAPLLSNGCTGPMWEEDTEFAGRSLMHPGAIPTATPAKTLAIGENYGEGSHTMTAQELAAHTHVVSITGKALDGANNPPAPVIVDDDAATVASVANAGTALANVFTGTQQPMPVIHPVRGIYLIKRTSRIFYRV